MIAGNLWVMPGLERRQWPVRLITLQSKYRMKSSRRRCCAKVRMRRLAVAVFVENKENVYWLQRCTGWLRHEGAGKYWLIRPADGNPTLGRLRFLPAVLHVSELAREVLQSGWTLQAHSLAAGFHGLQYSADRVDDRSFRCRRAPGFTGRNDGRRSAQHRNRCSLNPIAGTGDGGFIPA